MKTLEVSGQATLKNRRARRNSDRTVTDVDRRRLGTLISTRRRRLWCTTESMGQLEALLEDATAVAAPEAPETLVTMNTTVELADVDSGSRRRLTVVYPQEAEDAPDAVSVLEPLGLAMIGCQVGDVLQCPGEPDHDLRIAEIVCSPNGSGQINGE
jgi:regulator of nucleoside diphosphate kinase